MKRSTHECPKGRPLLLAVVNNHFDLTWRRCWNRRFTWGGQEFASYAEIEDAYMADNLKLARKHPEYKFMAECTAVARQYLRRHPERLPELKALAAAGRFEVSGSGDNIVDANLVLGETLVRNFLTGFLWLEKTLGQRVVCCVRNDAFGNSAQLPQIARGCGIPWVTGLTYSAPTGDYWRGLDGSTVYVQTLPRVGIGVTFTKLAPCLACGGRGCRRCEGRGFDRRSRTRLEPIDRARVLKEGASFVEIMAEETPPDPEVVPWLKRQAKGFIARFALDSEIAPLLADKLARVGAPPRGSLHKGREVNPNNTGCYATRIRLKQLLRRAEYDLLEAEFLAASATASGAAWPRAALARAWEGVLFAAFHDSVTGTHIDAAYDELMDTYRDVGKVTGRVAGRALRRFTRSRPGTLSVLNPTGFASPQVASVEIALRGRGVRIVDGGGRGLPVTGVEPLGGGRARVTFVAPAIAPLSAAHFRLRPGPAVCRQTLKAPRIENARFRITADERGVKEVYDKQLRRALLSPGACRPFELILEEDEGSPWATIKPSQERTGLSGCTRLISAERCGARQTLRFEINIDRLANHSKAMAWTTVALHDGLDRVEVATEVNWRACNTRLMAAFPVPAPGRHLYGIPYGVLERKPYKPWFDWKAANGDWPAINWAGLEGKGLSVAVLNRGLPCYRMEPAGRKGSMILLTLLRSPAYPTYLHEPESYTMTGYDGMRDGGRHRLEYAVAGYAEPLLESQVEADAQIFNAGMRAVAGEVTLPELPAIESDHVYVAALKVAEEGGALILRLAEHRGRAGRLRVRLPTYVGSMDLVNLLEREGRPVRIRDGVAELDVRAWEIVTLRLERR